LERSGAVKEYLENQGIPIDDLREAVQEKSSTRFEQSWADATQEFLNGPYGADWPGGDQNLEIIGLKLQQLGLTDAEDKVGALAKAYADMKSNSQVQENPEIERSQRLASANSAEEIRTILGRPEYSTIFGK
jgi:hypothetical protein